MSDAAIARGLAFLERRQLPSGEFSVLVGREHADMRDGVADPSPFGTSLIAYSLGLVDAAPARAMLAHAARFLHGEMEPPGVWRFWARGHPHHAVIPPDLDDTACAAYVLRQQGIATPPIDALLLACRDRGGRFHTWITPRWPMPRSAAYWRVALRQLANPATLLAFWRLNESAPGDVDGVVNANVLLYLGDRPETRPVAAYLVDIVLGGREAGCDKWHLNPFMVHYCIGRAFDAGVTALGAARDAVVRRITAAAHPSGRIGDTVLDTALAVCALHAWRAAPAVLDDAVRYLVAEQDAAGAWAPTALWYGGPKRYYGWGSAELTTGYCLEALARHRTATA